MPIKVIKNKLTNLDQMRSRSAINNISSNLYADALAKMKNKITIEEQKNINSQKTDRECTFSPNIKKYNSKMFKKNPIEKDPLILKEKERQQKARIEKEIQSILMTRGYSSIRTFRNINIILNDMKNKQILPDMKLSNEKKTNKDSLEKFSENKDIIISALSSGVSFNKNKTTHFHPNNFSKQFSSNICAISLDNFSGSDASHSNQNYINKDEEDNHLFTVELKINESQIEKFKFFENDDPYHTTEKFCSRYGLNDETKSKIIHLIEEKLKAVDA